LHRDDGETWLGNYRLISRIGSGGAGTVYLAHHAPTGQLVALKVLHQRADDDSEFVARFQREADAIAGLHRPNIVRVLEAGCMDGRCFIAMEYLNYGTLKDRIAAIFAGGEHMPVSEALEIAWQIASALDAAHKRRLIHRDVKPGNILLAAGGRYVLADFGTVLVQTATRLTTQSGRLIGTAEYLSPEQANQAPFDHRIDIYALGVVLYEMLTGRMPFSDENDLLVVYAHAYREPRPMDELRAGVPRDVTRIVAKAMHKQPARRYSTAGEMALDIERVMRDLEHASTWRVSPWSHVNLRMMWVVGVSVIVVMTLLLYVGVLRPVTHTPGEAYVESRFVLCEVTFTPAHEVATVMDAPSAAATSVIQLRPGVSLVVQARSRDASWLWVRGLQVAGWVRAQDGNLMGALSCVPEMPVMHTQEK
jgi:serine/threonine-protein kinase